MNFEELKIILKRLFNEYVKKHLKKIFFALLLSIIVAGSTSAIAWLLDPAVKKIFIEKNTTLSWVIPILIIIALAGKGLSLYVARLLIIRVGEEVSGVIKKQIAENPILIYMKGSPKLPSCGFSSQASQALMQVGEPFAYVDILQNPDIRAELPGYAEWPTFPQLWVDGELVGGCDIIMEMFQQNELRPLIKETAEKHKTEE